MALKESLQVVLQRAQIMEPNFQISCLLDSCIKDRNSLNWDLRFQRNSFRNIGGWLRNICFTHGQRKNFKCSNEWS